MLQITFIYWFINFFQNQNVVLFTIIKWLGEDTHKKNQMYFDSYCSGLTELCLD